MRIAMSRLDTSVVALAGVVSMLGATPATTVSSSLTAASAVTDRPAATSFVDLDRLGDATAGQHHDDRERQRTDPASS